MFMNALSVDKSLCLISLLIGRTKIDILRQLHFSHLKWLTLIGIGPT